MAQDTIIRPAYVEQLVTALTGALKGAEVDVEQVRGDHYRFTVVWSGFDSMGHPERQEMLWDIVEKALDKADVLKVTMIMALGLEDLPQENE